MNRNVEIKARVADLEAVRQRAEALADRGPEVLEQVDTFFHCPQGRLKLRQFGSPGAELIFYERPDAAGPKECRYMVHRISDPAGLRKTLSAALGVRGTVRKRRTVYFVGRTRVHLDEVEGLGHFVELEVAMPPDQSHSDGVTVASDLIAKLGITPDQLVDRAYIDLLDASTTP